MGFPRWEYWSELPGPSPGDLPDPGIEPVSPALASGFFPAESPGKPLICVILAQLLCKLGINISILYMRKCLKESVQLSLSHESCRLKNLDPCLSSLLFQNPVVFSRPPPAPGSCGAIGWHFLLSQVGGGGAARDEAEHPAMCETALPHPQNCPAPSSNSAEVQKPPSGFTALKLSFLAPRDKTTFH